MCGVFWAPRYTVPSGRLTAIAIFGYGHPAICRKARICAPTSVETLHRWNSLSAEAGGCNSSPATVTEKDEDEEADEEEVVLEAEGSKELVIAVVEAEDAAEEEKE